MATPHRSITVIVTLAADLRRYLPSGVDGPLGVTLSAGSTVEHLLTAIGIPANAVLTVGIDGKLAGRGTRLHDGSEVLLVSPMEGG